MEIKIKANKKVIALLSIIALLLFAILAKPYFIPQKAYAEFNNDNFENDSRNLEKIANSLQDISRSLSNIEGYLQGIERSMDK